MVLSQIERQIKEKIERVGTPLKDWDIQINYGIKTGFNEAFIIDGKKRQELINQDPKSAEIIRPILRGRDIKRYSYDFADLWLINTHNGIKDKGIKPININDYPAVKKHLDKYYPKLEKRQDKGDTPYNLRNCAYIEDFYKQKIMYSEIVREPQFYLDNTGEIFPEATTFILTGNHLEYLCNMFNSKTIAYAFKTFYAGGGLGESGYRYKKAFFEKLPIPKFSNTKIQQQIKNAQITDNIECLIYKLLEFNDAEIDFIQTQWH
ncbi:MAG: TaqI-like C-terminal specificity domain-containing protein [Paludibacter sp.]